VALCVTLHIWCGAVTAYVKIDASVTNIGQFAANIEIQNQIW